jgi:CheY-like chemotaxis protein
MLSSIHGIENKGDLELFNLHLTKPVKQSQLFKSLESLFSFSEVSKKGPFNSKDLLLKSSKAKILVVEDNLFNQKVAQKILERFGFKPSVAENGQIAFDEVMNNNYDLVFMDIQMPELDGMEATKQIQALLPKEKCPTIIAMTANAQQSDRNKCLEIGMDDYVAKPLKDGIVYEMIEKWGVKKIK